MSRTYGHYIASSEPTSPHAYSPNPNSASVHHHPLSPRAAGPQSPRQQHQRSHIRRASDYRSRAVSQMSSPSTRELVVPPFPSSSSHHRTATFPSYPTMPDLASGFSNGEQQLQHQMVPQPLASEFMAMPPIPGATLRHTPIAPLPPPPPLPAAAHSLGHVRTDSVMNTTEEPRFFSSSFQGNPTGPPMPHTRRRRGNLPKDATRVLRQWFDQHLDAPYPGEEVKNQLCQRTGLQMSQVRWSPLYICLVLFAFFFRNGLLCWSHERSTLILSP
jgi:hypothetical protein